MTHYRDILRISSTAFRSICGKLALGSAVGCVVGVAHATPPPPLFSPTPVSMPGGALEGEAIATGDFDNNGLPDFVVGTAGNAKDVIYLQGPPGMWAKLELPQDTTARDVAVGDMNGDGKEDIYIGTANAPDILYQNQTSGSVVSFSTTPGAEITDTHGVAIGDFDGNNFSDVAIATGPNDSHKVFMNIANHVPYPILLDPGVGLDNGSDVTIADFDADGVLDLYIVTANQKDLLYHWNPINSNFDLDASPGLTTQTYGESVVSGDFDGNHSGDDAFIVCGQGSEKDALMTLAKSPFTGVPEALKSTFLSVDARATSARVHAAVGDFNNDGEDDVAVVANGQAGFLYINDVAAAVQLQETKFLIGENLSGTTNARAVVAVDVDGDLDLDLIFADYDAAPFILINTLNTPPPPPPLDTDNDGIPNSADLDDDGDDMPDAWEIAFGTQPLIADADGDLDGDGLSNLDEFVSGSDPDDSSDYGQLLVSFVANGQLKLLFFRDAADESYYEGRVRLFTVEECIGGCPSEDDWTPVEGYVDLVGDDSQQIVDIVATGSQSRVYRLKIDLYP